MCDGTSTLKRSYVLSVLSVASFRYAFVIEDSTQLISHSKSQSLRFPPSPLPPFLLHSFPSPFPPPIPSTISL